MKKTIALLAVLMLIFSFAASAAFPTTALPALSVGSNQNSSDLGLNILSRCNLASNQLLQYLQTKAPCRINSLIPGNTTSSNSNSSNTAPNSAACNQTATAKTASNAACNQTNGSTVFCGKNISDFASWFKAICGGTPAIPATPAKPATPTTPAKPTTPATPAKPATPTTPITPAKPTTPTAPTTPAKPTTPTTPSAGSSTESAYAAEVARLVNVERAKAGLSALKVNVTLQSAAQLRAKETVTSFSHTRPNGTSAFTVLDEFNITYRGAGENIAMGQTSPAQVMNGWMNSSGHRANILNASFTTIGVGCYRDASGRLYWSQEFIY